MAAIRGTDFDAVRQGDVASVPIRFIKKHIAEYKILHGGEILIEAAGGSKGQITGRTIYLKPETVARFSIPVTCASFSRFIRLKRSELCDTRYVFWLFQYLYHFGFMDKYHTQHTGVSRFQWTVFAENEPLSFPPLPTQRKIAAILSAYDDLIENNLRRIKILEEMAQNLYREWFVKFRFPGHENVRFVDSPLGLIPEGWECGVVNDLASLKSGFAFKSSLFKEDGTYGLVTIRNVRDGLFVPDCTSWIADLPSNMPSYCHLSTGDVLLSLTGNIGRVCLVYGTDYLLNQRVAKLVSNEATNRAYIYFTFRQDEFQTKLSKIANGVAQQNLSPIETGRMQVVKPSQKALADFAGVCEPIIEEMTTLFQKNSALRRTRDLLLPRLISGELDVSELDITIPEEIA